MEAIARADRTRARGLIAYTTRPDCRRLLYSGKGKLTLIVASVHFFPYFALVAS
jgi:hypothetical protein